MLHLLFAEQQGQHGSTEDGQVAGRHAHGMVPFSPTHLFIVIGCQLADALVGIHASGHAHVERGRVALHTLHGSACSHLPCALCFQHLHGVGGGTLHRIAYGGKVGIAQFGAQQGGCFVDAPAHRVVAQQVVVQFSSEGGGAESRVAHLTESPVVGCFRQFRLAPSHELRATFSAKAVELVHGGRNGMAHLRAKLAAQPLAVVLGHGGMAYGMDIPSHVEKQF